MENKPKKKVKTYKRELAFICVVMLFIMAFMGMLEALALLVTPTFGFAIVAYGMDSAAKQFKVGKEEKQEDFYDT